MPQIRSGAVCVPEGAYRLLPTIYRIHPIDKLTIPPTRQHIFLGALPDILGAIPQIPDVVISGPAYISFGMAKLIANLSRGGTDSVVFVGMGFVRVSHPQQPPPIRWVQAPRLLLDSLRDVLWAVILIMPFILLYAIIISINLYRIFNWIYRRVFGPPWDHTARIAADLMHVDTTRIQTVSGPGAAQFSLVTSSDAHGPLLTIHPLTLSLAQSTALLAALDLKEHLISLTVWTDCALNLSSLLSFVHRHHLLSQLILRPGAIDPASLPQEPIARTHPGRITFLKAPAGEIPHILPTERCVETLVISPASDPKALSLALTAIAALSHDDARLRELTLDFTRPKRTTKKLPWRTDPDVEAASVLHGVVQLKLIGQFKYRAADALDLPRWLGRFPQLQRLEFYRASVPVAERAALAQAIAQARVGTSAAAWESVEFYP
ncbi:hypothetical protein B0H19DRAFT_1257946 [Mycena capillaripes]|nr:hypothetical protein B0H19DRAFT_1257946 [Mycena capillaripes]